jgi:hypothetical protein
MNKRTTPQSGSMNELQQGLFEKQMLSIAKGLDYPRTPDVAGSVMTELGPSPSPQGGVRGKGGLRFISRRLVWSLTIILILFSSLMLIPPARAAIIEFIQIGVVRIFRAEPTPLAPPNQEIPSTEVPVTATPVPTSQPLIPILEKLAGEMTLEEAQKAVNYPILLPSYPADLGQPDRVFVQEAEGKMTILVWIDPLKPSQVLMSLHLIPAGSWAIDKFDPALVQETRVNGQRAIWAVGPYPLRLRNSDLQYMRLIEGHVLIWTDGDLTYRLETESSVEDAIKVAESLKPIQP